MGMRCWPSNSIGIAMQPMNRIHMVRKTESGSTLSQSPQDLIKDDSRHVVSGEVACANYFSSISALESSHSHPVHVL